MATSRHIIALGGGGFSMEESPALDDYILAAAGARTPRVCFVPTASGDSEAYVARFYKAFEGRDCQASHLALFRRKAGDLRDFLLSQDVIYVGGGNTSNMLAVWSLHGVDQILKDAYHAGIVLAGVSAGAVCWFEAGTTDSFGPNLSAFDNGLGLLSGSMCPHYDGEEKRRPTFHGLVQSEALPGGYGVDDSVALHFRNEALHRVVSSHESARAYTVRHSVLGPAEATLDSEFIGTSVDKVMPPEA